MLETKRFTAHREILDAEVTLSRSGLIDTTWRTVLTSDRPFMLAQRKAQVDDSRRKSQREAELQHELCATRRIERRT